MVIGKALQSNALSHAWESSLRRLEGRILDGRNRHAACLIAGVEPTFTTYDGDDPAGYALAVNIQRRNLTRGQRAMAVVTAADVTNNLSLRKLAGVAEVSREYTRQAGVVLEAAPDLVEAVTAGFTPLNVAYKTAQQRKAAGMSRSLVN